MKKENLVHIFDWDAIAELSRKTVAEGCVLLKNEKNALPITSGSKVAVFGRSQFNYYKSGTGSGGAVNAPYVRSILDAFYTAEENGEVFLDKNVQKEYETWLESNPFDAGEGWASEPWNQKEMPLSSDLVETAAENNDAAVFILGRTAGEDKDNRVAAGSYLLTEAEEKALETITRAFDKTIVVLNVGNIIDMKWVEKFDPQAVIYVWQGGMVGGDGTIDVLLGRKSPSGHLADTIAGYMTDYPSTANFGADDRNYYAEDIYIGYRYFETFDKEKVMYPFGFGLSYTEFEIKSTGVITEGEQLVFSFDVANKGSYCGAQVVQLYLEKPQGKLGQPARSLAGFVKTRELNPGESENVCIKVSYEDLSSYDDSGKSGFRYSYVAEAGDYNFYAGDNVRDAVFIFSLNIGQTVCVRTLGSALAPNASFDRIRPVANDAADEGGHTYEKAGYRVEYEPVPLKDYDIADRIKENRPDCHAYTGDKGIKLEDVQSGKKALDEFLAQLSDEDLIYMSRGEGMCSPKVTPGTAAAFGGVTDELAAFGIPTGCCADGPSGIRMDCGSPAFSMPNGTLQACTFDLPLIEKLYEMEGMDLRRNKIDLLLGPGINMHRNPLNGRNFEYFSEDPLLTGKMAAAQLRGMAVQGVSGTIKHFAGNEQEWKRYDVDSMVSERALREIYLKPFEIAVKEGGAYSVMTTYGSLNGQWTAGNYDLVTTILRNEWGFDGIVMTDWWAKINEEGGEASMGNTVPMVRAQNDIYMVVSNSLENSGKDNTSEGLREGKLTRGELVRNAANICKVLMRSPCMKRFVTGTEEKWEQIGLPEGIIEEIDWKGQLEIDNNASIDLSDLPTDKGKISELFLAFRRKGRYHLIFEMSSDASRIAQMPMNIWNGNTLLGTISIHGTDGEIEERSIDIPMDVILSTSIKFKFGMSGIKLHRMRVEKIIGDDRGSKFD